MTTMGYPAADLTGYHFESAFHRLELSEAQRNTAPVHKNWNDTFLGFSLVSFDGVRFYCDAHYVREQSASLRALLPEHPPHGTEHRFTSEHATPGAVNQLLYAIQDEYTRVDWSEVAGDFYQDLVDLFHLSIAYSIPCGAQSVINFIRRELASSDVKSFADSAYLFIVACQCDEAELAAEIVRQDRLPANSRQGAKFGYWKGINYTWGHVRGQGGLYYDNFTPEMMQMLTQPYRLGLHLSSQVQDMDEAARVFLTAVRG